MVEMPYQWFQGTNTGRRIGGILQDEIARPLAEGERVLASFILPRFQRPRVWTLEQSTKLIQSLWEGLPIGTYIVNRTQLDIDNPTNDWLLDGQQRWTAISSYVAGEFPFLGVYYPELSIRDQKRFQNITVNETSIYITDPDICYQIYERLAYGGTPHEPKMDDDSTYHP